MYKLITTSSWRYQQPYVNPSFLMSFLARRGVVLFPLMWEVVLIQKPVLKVDNFFAVVHCTLLKRVWNMIQCITRSWTLGSGPEWANPLFTAKSCKLVISMITCYWIVTILVCPHWKPLQSCKLFPMQVNQLRGKWTFAQVCCLSCQCIALSNTAFFQISVYLQWNTTQSRASMVHNCLDQVWLSQFQAWLIVHPCLCQGAQRTMQSTAAELAG